MSRSLPRDNVQGVSNFCSHQLDPIQDLRWTKLVERHPKASVFHTVPWLEALRRTYGYEPVVFTTSAPTDELKNGLVFCCVNSWLTGRRLVSLPFSDHCEPLCDSTEELNFLVRYLQTIFEHQHWKYLEMRPINGKFERTNDEASFLPAGKFFLHRLNLRATLDELFRGLDKDCVQRRIERAERAGLVERCGRSDELLKGFYGLFVLTRRRHCLPPIPYHWFRNLIDCLGKQLEIRLAYQDKTPISAILTLRFREVAYYKYGCSDTRFNRFGATSWLLWKAIAAAKSNGASEFDMGRTQEDNAGLLTYKNHWAPQPKQLVYWTFPQTSSLGSINDWELKLAKRALTYMPDRLLPIIGRLIYRHIG